MFCGSDRCGQQRYRVVDEAIQSSKRHCGIRQDARPFSKGVIGGYHQAPPLVAGGDQLEQHGGLGLILADVAEVIEDQQVIRVELLDGVFERQGLTRLLQTLHQIGRPGEQDSVAVLHQGMAKGRSEMRFAGPARAKQQDGAA
jgi:hypothetical protein